MNAFAGWWLRARYDPEPMSVAVMQGVQCARVGYRCPNRATGIRWFQPDRGESRWIPVCTLHLSEPFIQEEAPRD